MHVFITHCFLKLIYFRKAYTQTLCSWCVNISHGKIKHIRRLNRALCTSLLQYIILYKKVPDLSNFSFFSLWPLWRCRSINSDTFPRYLFLHRFPSQTEPSPLLYHVHVVMPLTYCQMTPSFPTRLPSYHAKAWTKYLKCS